MNKRDILHIEKNVALLWKRALHIENLSLDDNFFALGGHSLLAVDLINEIELDLNVRLNLRDLVEAPTVRELSKIIESYQGRVEHESLMDLSQTIFPLTLNQKQMWGVNALNPHSAVHNISSAIRIKRELKLDILNRVMNALIARHESLRTRFKVVSGVPRQEIIPPFTISFNFVDVHENEVSDVIKKEMKHVFKLDEAPLMRFFFYRLGKEDFVFFFVFHHIAWDGLSNTFFFHEFMALYKSLDETGDLPPAEAHMTYKEHALLEAAWLKSDDFVKQKERWKTYLSGDLPVLNLPTDYPRPKKINNDSGTVYFEVKRDLLTQLENYAQAKNLSLYNVCFTVYNILLAKLSGDNEIIVGTPVHGRLHRESRKTLGNFINTLPVRTKLEIEQSFRHNLSVFMKSLKQAFYNQNMPLDVIIQTAQIEPDPTRTPLFQSLYVYLDVTKELDVLKQENFEQLKADRFSVHTELDFYFYKSREKVDGVIEYRKDLYKPETIRKMGELYMELLDKVSRNDQVTLTELGLKEKEISHEYVEFDDKPYEKVPGTLLNEFAHQLQLHPDKLAVQSRSGHLSYKELNERADKIAHGLREKSIGKGSFVGVYLSRNENLPAALLGILKTGAGYVPLDPQFPAERLNYMVEKSGASIVLTEKKLPSLKAETVFLEEALLASAGGEDDTVSPADSCYILFTSGSTGRPKGVEVTHLNVLNFLKSMQGRPGFQDNDKLLSVTTISFDISVLELFLPLISGGSVFIADEEDVKNGERLLKIIEEENISCMQATPTTWRLMLMSGWRQSFPLKVLCGGEPLPKDLAKKLLTKVSELWNMYGPTETTVWSTVKKIEVDDKKILIGSPIKNTVAYVLDSDMKPCPIGVPGDLYIGGLGVARGYFKDEVQTHAKFLTNPFREGEVMYHTGDLARFVCHGDIECLGRSDDQVKVRGFRIELGEIENAILQNSAIHECAVKVHEQRIVGYAVFEKGLELPESQIINGLKDKLPYYMIPSKIVFLEELPKTLNGKIDRKVLNEGMGMHTHSDVINENSQTIEEITLIWERVLGKHNLKADDNFFSVGGHSIAAVEIFGIMGDRFQVDLPLSSLLEASTIREFSAIVDAALLKRQQDIAKLKCVVPIKSAFRKSEPVFCFHGVGGNVLNYYQLAHHVGHRAFYGIQSLGVNGIDQISECIHEMAANYIEEIKKVQPNGPYILAGGSMGGMIALEAAIQLTKNGDEIKSLIMFDTVGPDLDFKTYGEEKVSFIYQMKNSLRYRFEKMLNHLKVNFYLATKASIPHSIRYFSIENKNFVALRRYRPEIYEGNITLIRAPRKSKGYYADPYLGWRNTINGKIETIEIEGEHKNFIESPALSSAFKSVLSKL